MPALGEIDNKVNGACTACALLDAQILWPTFIFLDDESP